MKFSKTKLFSISICILLCISLLFSLIACNNDDLQNQNGQTDDIPTFSEIAEYLFTLILDGDGLYINTLLDYPELFDFTSYDIALPIPTYDDADSQLMSSLAYVSMAEEIMNYECKTLDDEITQNFLYNTFINYSQYNNYYFREFLGNNGVVANIPTHLEIFQFKSERDIDLYIDYMEKLSITFDDYLYFERFRAKNGYGRSDSFYESAITAYKNIIDETTDPSLHSFTTDFNDKIENVRFELSSSEITTYKNQNQRAVNNLLDAYEDLIEGIEDFLLEYPTETRNQGGLALFEGGQEYYKALFKMKTGSSDTIEAAVNKLVVSTKNHYNLATIYSNYGGSIDALEAYYETEANAFTVENATAVFEDLKSSLADIMPGISNFPSVDINLLKPSQRSEFVSAYYVDSAIDNLNATENIYINPDHNSSLLYSLIAHEGYPGHLYQNVYLKNNNVNKIRQLLSNTCFSEGWAVYVEEIVAPYFSDNTILKNSYLLSTYSEKLSRDLIALVDIFVNYYGLSLDEVISKLNIYEVNYFGDGTAKSFYNQAVLLPGLYLPYAYGDIMIKEIKSTYFENASSFDFHEALLKIGPVDFDTLAKYIMLV
ncbi:MAG: DUF885 domain-containing protein [Christensenellaceae bacterium]|jgi:uncharacterized protein (DUF885 family)|nr:DUF885 domain-containing protein [Christensenellaceae bacterium]